MSSVKYSGWNKSHTMTWEEYFDSRFIEAIKLGKLLVEEVGEKRAFKIIAEKTFENGTEFGKEIKGDKPLLQMM